MFNPWFSVTAFEGCEVVALYETYRRAGKFLSGMLDNNPWGRQHVAANASRQVTARPRLVGEQARPHLAGEAGALACPTSRYQDLS